MGGHDNIDNNAQSATRMISTVVDRPGLGIAVVPRAVDRV
jgi:hypothetical protein